MDYNARNTVVLFRSTSVHGNVIECLQRLWVTANSRLGHFVIINTLLSRCFVNFNALIRFGRQISFGKIKLDPAAIDPAAHAGFNPYFAPIFSLFLLELKRLAGLDLRYNWSISPFVLPQVQVA